MCAVVFHRRVVESTPDDIARRSAQYAVCLYYFCFQQKPCHFERSFLFRAQAVQLFDSNRGGTICQIASFIYSYFFYSHHFSDSLRLAVTHTAHIYVFYHTLLQIYTHEQPRLNIK